MVSCPYLQGIRQMFKKVFLFLFMFFQFQCAAFAGDVISEVNKIIDSFDFDRDSVISISVKDKKTDKVIYSKNPYKYLNPASVLKLFTMGAALNTLGEDYKFKTVFYKDKHNNYYLKLSGDPLLTSSDMEELAKKLETAHKGKINKIYIDDSVMDLIPYPDGWTVDDYWPDSPKISPYTVDNNTVKVDFYLSADKKDVRIIQKSPYKFSFVNKLKIADTTDFTFVFDEVHNTINIEGTISQSVTDKEIPVLNPRYFFCTKMNAALNKSGIHFNDKFLFAKTPENVSAVASFERPLKDVIRHILLTSDNSAAEIVFKVAGGVYAAETSPVKDGFDSFGTTKNGINMFIDYYNNLGIDTRQIKIRDGSGVSRYNVVNTSSLVEMLSKMNFDFEKYLPTPGGDDNSGTLQKRMRELKDAVYLKTGTLFGTSSLAGIIKTGDNEYYYASIIMSYRNKSLIKGVEDEVVYQIYREGQNEEN